MDPETHESSLAAKSDIHVKGSKRMKILKEREDCVSSTLSAKMGIDMEEKTTRDAPKVVDSFDPFAIHNLSRTLDRSRFGSVTEEIEALRSEKRKRLNLISHRMKLPQSFMSSDVGKTKRRNFLNLAEKQDAQPSHSNVINKHVSPPVLLVDIDLQVSNQATETFSDQSVTQPAQNVLHLEDDNARNGDKEVPTVIIIIDSSDDEDDEVQMLSYHCHKAAKIVTDVPSMNDPMVRDSAEKEAPKNEGGSAATENDIGLSKSSNLHDYCVEVRDSVEREVHEEEGSNKSAFVIDIADDIGSRPSEIYIEMNKIVDHVTDCSERKALEEEVEADPDIDVKSAKSSYIETDGNMMIEEDNDPIHIADNVGSQSSKIVAEMGISFDHVEKETSGKEVESVPDIAVMDKMHIDTSDDMVIEEINEQSDLATDDCLDNIWREMAFAFESSKDIAPVSVSSEHKEDDEECDHIFVLKDDLGDVCRICGIIGKSIETIFDFQYSKVVRTIRTYASEPRNRSSRGLNTSLPSGVNSLPDNSMPSETCIHPRHRKQMKPHQVEGFNFLCNNLLADKPGGCILAHAPGSGKTFMIISFLQSFLAKHPNGRPLVILPKGILATWKKEFQTWQVEDMALLDFYSSKAESRSQQLDVLLQWENHKSILFLGYQQFSKIVCDRSKEAADCQDKLLKVPSILILDEGHTPRNDETDIVQSLAKVRTPRKVVLSGTLYQNHVKEVFSILNLVRPKFLRLDTSIAARNSIMSIVHVPGSRKHLKAGNDSAFFELVENTLQKDENLNRKKAVIRKLREMTTNVLHYYKGDSLDELPGLVDFTVVLNLSEKQKEVVQKLKKENRFKQFALGSALYVHPELKDFSALSSASKDRNSSINNEKIDKMLEKLNPRHGVKMKFFLNILGLCESTGEKLLVFSQYILPLKFLERASVKSKGWIVGKEIFLITGDTNDEQRERFMQQFNSSPDAKVFFGSIKACGEGISLVGASRILILDVHLNPSVTRQALGRAFRPGQKRKVYTYRLIAAGSPEEEDYHTCFRKEIISKMWFEWNESSEYRDSQLKNVDLDECDDMFFESPLLKEDLKVLYTR